MKPMMLFVLLAIVACGPDRGELHYATVMSKGHRAAWSQPFFNGKTTTVIYHPARWWLDLRATHENGVFEYRISSSHELWDLVSVGDQLNPEQVEREEHR